MVDDGHSYIIRGGKAGSDRLMILANATWPTSARFLQQAGLQAGMTCLDLGCGNGEISSRIAGLVGDRGSVFGVDMDQAKIEIARSKALKAEDKRLCFLQSDLESQELALPQEFDFVYLRFLLSHLKDPVKLLQKLKTCLKPGAILAIEDVEFDGHHCHPACAAFDRYVELYKKMATRRGADANIGLRLSGLFTDAGYASPSVMTVTPKFSTGDGKLMALITMQAISEGAVQAGLISQNEVEDLIESLATFTEDSTSLMSIPTLHQVWTEV